MTREIKPKVETQMAGAHHPATEIHGTCSDRFSGVLEAFANNLNSGQDIGASVAVFIDGESVIDLWGGYFDATYTRPWARGNGPRLTGNRLACVARVLMRLSQNSAFR